MRAVFTRIRQFSLIMLSALTLATMVTWIVSFRNPLSKKTDDYERAVQRAMERSTKESNTNSSRADWAPYSGWDEHLRRPLAGIQVGWDHGFLYVLYNAYTATEVDLANPCKNCGYKLWKDPTIDGSSPCPGCWQRHELSVGHPRLFRFEVAGPTAPFQTIASIVIPFYTLMLVFGAYPSVALIRFLRGPYRRRRRRARGQCEACAYNLTANTTGICPECGTSVSERS